jgi:hypothetical protein
MTKKTSFNIDKALSRIARPSVFDRLVKEVDAVEVPSKYIDHITVVYHDGSVVDLRGDEINHPIPVNRSADKSALEESFKKMKDVKLFLNTEVLEDDVNAMVERLLGRLC